MDYQLLLMCCAALLAGFVDSIVGGGGLVQVPALFILYPHFEIPRIIGTNRFSSFMGTAVAGYQYAKKVEIPWRTVIYAGIGAGLMAFLGAKISDLIDEKILKPIILVLMTAIAIYTFKKKDFGYRDKNNYERFKQIIERSIDVRNHHNLLIYGSNHINPSRPNSLLKNLFTLFDKDKESPFFGNTLLIANYYFDCISFGFYWSKEPSKYNGGLYGGKGDEMIMNELKRKIGKAGCSLLKTN